MSINLSIRWSHPEANQAKIRYARIDNTGVPTWVLVTPNPVVSPITNTVSIATNLPNGQYAVESTPVYADGRTCSPTVDYTPVCPGLIAINASINLGNIVVTWTADAFIPKARISVSFPNGGSYVNTFNNIGVSNTTTIPIPPGNNGQITVRGQSVCDDISGFYSGYSNTITLNNSGNTNPVMSQFILGNNINTLCNGGSVNLYTNGPFGIGKVLYNDSLLSNPVTGYTFAGLVSDLLNTAGDIYSIDSLTGTVLSENAQKCSVEVRNMWNSNSYKIINVVGIPGFTFPGSGVGLDSHYSGIKNALMVSTVITVSVSASPAASGCLRLYKNGFQTECLAVTGDGSYSFGPISANSDDTLTIYAENSTC